MMTRFFGDETTLKTILLMCDPIVISNALVSYVMGLEEKFQLLMTSIGIGLSFSTKANLCCWTNYLLMKNAYALKSTNVLFPFPWTCWFDNDWKVKKHGVGSKDKLGPFSSHDPLFKKKWSFAIGTYDSFLVTSDVYD